MTARRTSPLGRAAARLIALALLLSGVAPSHSHAGLAGDPLGDGPIVICSPDGLRLIDPATGEPVETRPLAGVDCGLCCCASVTALRAARVDCGLRLSGAETAVLEPDDGQLQAAGRPRSPAVPRAPPLRSAT